MPAKLTRAQLSTLQAWSVMALVAGVACYLRPGSSPDGTGGDVPNTSAAYENQASVKTTITNLNEAFVQNYFLK